MQSLNSADTSHSLNLKYQIQILSSKEHTVFAQPQRSVGNVSHLWPFLKNSASPGNPAIALHRETQTK